MKRAKSVFILMVFISISLYARPQFFIGGGVDCVRMHPSDYVMSELKTNERYINEENSLDYVFYLLPKAEITFIPYASFPLGVSVKSGYGFVTGRNDGLDTYNYSLESSSDNYRYGSDDVFSISGGLRYIHLAISDKYFSVTGSLSYNYERFSLSKVPLTKGEIAQNRDNLVFSEHSLSLELGIMARYDKSYFKIDAEIRKAIDWDKGLKSLLDKNGYSLALSVTVGFVFTMLKNNQFMR